MISTTDLVEGMNSQFTALESHIKDADRICKALCEKDSSSRCIGTDCPFHAAFEINTEYGCRLEGVKSIMKKRPRRREGES